MRDRGIAPVEDANTLVLHVEARSPRDADERPRSHLRGRRASGSTAPPTSGPRALLCRPPVRAPEISYARSGDVSLAYAITGTGQIDLVFVHGYVGNLETASEQPLRVAFFEGLASFARVIEFDRRGTGLSDRVREVPTLEREWTTCVPSWTQQARSVRRWSARSRRQRWQRCRPRPIRACRGPRAVG